RRNPEEKWGASSTTGEACLGGRRAKPSGLRRDCSWTGRLRRSLPGRDAFGAHFLDGTPSALTSWTGRLRRSLPGRDAFGAHFLDGTPSAPTSWTGRLRRP